jgi:hypothetical protein
VYVADHGSPVGDGVIAGQEWITGLGRIYGSGNAESSAIVREQSGRKCGESAESLTKLSNIYGSWITDNSKAPASVINL